MESNLRYAKPWIMIDDALEVEPGVRAVSVKNVSSSDFFLIGHFPERSIYPGMLLLEGIRQTVDYLLEQRADGNDWTTEGASSRFLRAVVPGDRVKYVVQCVKEGPTEVAFAGEGWVGEHKAIQAEIRLRKEGEQDES